MNKFDNILKQKNFLLLGSTKNETKVAYIIKDTLLNKNYNVLDIYDISDLDKNYLYDVIIMCINPQKGYELIKELDKPKYVVIQPGAESNEIIDYLVSNNIDFVQDCILQNI